MPGNLRVAGEPNSSLVDFLEEKLQQAKEGKIIGLVCVLHYEGDTSGSRVIVMPGARPNLLIGELALIEHDMKTREVERRTGL